MKTSSIWDLQTLTKLASLGVKALENVMYQTYDCLFLINRIIQRHVYDVWPFVFRLTLVPLYLPIAFVVQDSDSWLLAKLLAFTSFKNTTIL